MFQVIFKNMDSSSLMAENVQNKIFPTLEKFPDLKSHRVTVTLEMENSPFQAGPDLFSVSVMVTGKKYKNIRIKKSSENFYVAVSNLTESFTEHLSRKHEKMTTKSRVAIKLKEAI